MCDGCEGIGLGFGAEPTGSFPLKTRAIPDGREDARLLLLVDDESLRGDDGRLSLSDTSGDSEMVLRGEVMGEVRSPSTPGSLGKESVEGFEAATTPWDQPPRANEALLDSTPLSD